MNAKQEESKNASSVSGIIALLLIGFGLYEGYTSLFGREAPSIDTSSVADVLRVDTSTSPSYAGEAMVGGELYDVTFLTPSGGNHDCVYQVTDAAGVVVESSGRVFIQNMGENGKFKERINVGTKPKFVKFIGCRN